MAAKLTKTSSVAGLKFVLVPLVVFVSIVALGAFAYNFSKQKIAEQQREIAKEEKEVSVLASKVAILQEERDLLALYEPQALSVLPNENPVLYQIFRFKEIAESAGTSVDDLRVSSGAGTSAQDELSSISLKFSVAGSTEALLSLVSELRGQAPLFEVHSVEMEIQEDSASADIEATSYYSALPENLPPITTPITRVSRDELEAFNSYNASSGVSGFTLESERGDATRNPFVF